MTRIEKNVFGNLGATLSCLFWMEIIKELKDDFPMVYDKHHHDFVQERDIFREEAKMLKRIIEGGEREDKNKGSRFYNAVEEAFLATVKRLEREIHKGLETKQDLRTYFYNDGHGWVFYYKKGGEEVKKHVHLYL